jgi:hypothetical protein
LEERTSDTTDTKLTLVIFLHALEVVPEVDAAVEDELRSSLEATLEKLESRRVVVVAQHRLVRSDARANVPNVGRFHVRLRQPAPALFPLLTELVAEDERLDVPECTIEHHQKLSTLTSPGQYMD